MCGFYAEATDREFRPSAEIDQALWVSTADIESGLDRDEIRLPPPVSIAFRLIADWYRAQCGKSLEELVKSVW